LGLAIAAEIVAVHGGHLELLDTKEGAAFLFDIPDRGRHASHEAPVAAAPPGPRRTDDIE
jgi:K+-sensing histidine kinase KdpD